MKKENKGKNGHKIYTIYFQSNYCEAEAKNLLKNIARIGETDDFYNPNSLESLYLTFDKISDAIQKSYKLKLNN